MLKGVIGIWGVSKSWLVSCSVKGGFRAGLLGGGKDLGFSVWVVFDWGGVSLVVDLGSFFPSLGLRLGFCVFSR